MPSNVDPHPLVQRYESGVPLAQDLLSDMESFLCATRSQKQAPYTYAGRPIQSDPPGWDPTLVSPASFQRPSQLAALGCGTMLSFPHAHPERVQYFDKVRRTTARVDGHLEEIPEINSRAFELVRAPAIRFGLATLERIAIYAQAAVVDGEGDLGDPIILGGPLGQQMVADEMGVLWQMPDPCPFPIPPVADNGTTPGLSVRFYLVNYPYAAHEPIEPPFMFNAMPRDIPPDFLIPPWEDMRYQWGSPYTLGHKWIAPGRSLIRLFAVVSVWDAASNSLGWQIEFRARLSGYNQNAGPDAAAQRGALWRI